MNHKHVGPADQACDGCLIEANADFRQRERRKTVAGLILLIGLVIVGMYWLSRYLSQNGSHIR